MLTTMMAKVNFYVKAETKFGQIVKVVGNIPILGMWEPKRGLGLITNEQSYPFWRSQCNISVEIGKSHVFIFFYFFSKKLYEILQIGGSTFTWIIGFGLRHHHPQHG